ncbi:MAG TPA: hemagglutinin protein, partial [Flavobacteriales bacterium]|nr:hemagglutinin protein [Flavobacteriales bacterium]
VAPALLQVTGKNAIVDWMLVELRNPTTPGTVVATRSALLQRDGDVVGTNGLPRLLFNVPNGNYHVAVRHRNHLGVMTGTPRALNADPVTVDFTQPTAQVYGTSARASIAPGRAGQWAGNVVRDLIVRYTGTSNDRDPILMTIGSTVPSNTVPGYLPTDVNLDGVTKYTGSGNDRDRVILTIGGNTPNNTRTEQLP